MDTVTTAGSGTVNTPAGRRRRLRALAVVAATATALAVWVVAVPLAGVELLAESAGTRRRVGPVDVVVAALLAGLAGWVLLALLERLTRRATAIWTGVALAVLLVSLLGPLTQGVGTPARVTLVALHLAVGVLVPALRRTGRGAVRPA